MTDDEPKKVTKSIGKVFGGSQPKPQFDDQPDPKLGFTITTGKPRPKSDD